MSDSRDFLRPWIQVPPEGDPSGDAWFDATLATDGDSRYEKLLVCSPGGDVMGAINFNEIVRGAFHSAYLGYWIGARYARQGVMTQAVALALRHGFSGLRLHRVEANLLPENAGSKALVKKLGFVKEGFSRRYLRIGERWRDHERWALTVEDWRERP